MSVISENIRYIRKQKSLTQEQLAERIGIKRSLLGAYEEARAEPSLTTIITIAKVLEVPVESLIADDLTQPDALKKTLQKDIEGKKLRVLSITVDQDDRENIVLVPQKAAAGYLNGYADPEYVSELPQFHLPFFSNGTYRAFEIKGDSMLPLPSSSIVIGQYVENWKQVKDDATYVLMTKDEGVVYKRVYNHINQKGVFTLVSDNPAYDAYDVNAEDLMEIWEAKAYFSTEFPKAQMSVEKLASMVVELQKKVKRK